MHDFLDHPRTVRPGEELDVARLEAFLLQHFSGSSGLVAVEQFPSGHSNLTYLVRLGDREFMLRRPPFGSKVKGALKKEESSLHFGGSDALGASCILRMY